MVIIQKMVKHIYYAYYEISKQIVKGYRRYCVKRIYEVGYVDFVQKHLLKEINFSICYQIKQLIIIF